MQKIRFVAIGDSFTEGVGDAHPDGRTRGWADLVAQGWADAAGFWAQPALAGTVPGADAEAQVVVRSRYFDLRSEVELSGVQVVMSSTLALDPSNRLRVVARRWTLDE